MDTLNRNVSSIEAAAPAEFPDAIVSARVWATWVRSLPTWNLNILMPGLQELVVAVTRDRIRFAARFLFMRSTTDFWLGAAQAPPDADAVIDMRAGRSRWLGSYLEIESRRQELGASRLIRSRRLRVRLYLRDPERLLDAATHAVLDSDDRG